MLLPLEPIHLRLFLDLSTTHAARLQSLLVLHQVIETFQVHRLQRACVELIERKLVHVVCVGTPLRLQFAEVEGLLGVSQRAVVGRTDLLSYQSRILSILRSVELA